MTFRLMPGGFGGAGAGTFAALFSLAVDMAITRTFHLEDADSRNAGTR